MVKNPVIPMMIDSGVPSFHRGGAALKFGVQTDACGFRMWQLVCEQGPNTGIR